MPNSINLNLLDALAFILATVAVAEIILIGAYVEAHVGFIALAILGWCFFAKAISLPATISHALRKARTGA